MTTVIYTPEAELASEGHFSKSMQQQTSEMSLPKSAAQGSAVTEMKVRNTVFPPWNEKFLR